MMDVHACAHTDIYTLVNPYMHSTYIHYIHTLHYVTYSDMHTYFIDKTYVHTYSKDIGKTLRTLAFRVLKKSSKKPIIFSPH